MSAYQIQSYYDAATHTVSHIVWETASHEAAVIDSVLDFDIKSGRTSTTSADLILAFLRQHDLQLRWILETHAHADHLSAAQYLQAQAGGKTAIGARIGEVQRHFSSLFNFAMPAQAGQDFDCLLNEGDLLNLGAQRLRVLHTPGHTPACISYLIGDDAFIGDTLFMPDYGSARCDFPGGDAAILYASVQKLYALPENTRLHLCHDYPPAQRAPQWLTTVAQQKHGNCHIHEGVSLQDFVSMRVSRDKTLPVPQLLLPSIQVNIHAGKLPEAESNGVRYLKIPLNKL